MKTGKDKHNPLRNIPNITPKRREKIMKMIESAAKERKFKKPDVDCNGFPTHTARWGMGISIKGMGAKEQVEARSMLEQFVLDHADGAMINGLPVRIIHTCDDKGWTLGCSWEFYPEYYVTK